MRHNCHQPGHPNISGVFSHRCLRVLLFTPPLRHAQVLGIPGPVIPAHLPLTPGRQIAARRVAPPKTTPLLGSRWKCVLSSDSVKSESPSGSPPPVVRGLLSLVCGRRLASPYQSHQPLDL